MAELPNVKTPLGNVRVHTRRVAEEITQRWTIYYLWGIANEGHHADGRALDFMTLTKDQKTLRTIVGHEIAAYFRVHHERLGVEYIIWRQRIWNSQRVDDAGRKQLTEWRIMPDRGSTTENHMDHVHVSFLNNPPNYKPLKDDMPTVKEIWQTDGILDAPPSRGKTNQKWRADSYLKEIYERTVVLEKRDVVLEEELSNVQEELAAIKDILAGVVEHLKGTKNV